MATARFFALDSVADTIASVMQNIVNLENAVDFYYSFRSYFYPQQEGFIFHMFLRNFGYWNYKNHETFCSKVLIHIDDEFMEKLVKSDSLIVQDDMDLYNILKRWIVDKMKLRTNYDFFKMWARPEPFLETKDGEKYQKIYSLLNLEQLCTDTRNIDQLKKDNIVPASWLHRACAKNYIRLAKFSNDSIQSIPSAFSCRIAVFYPDKSERFKATSVEFFGVNLKFAWVKKSLFVTCDQPLKSLCYSGSIAIAFRYNFHTLYTDSEPKTKILRINQGASLELAQFIPKFKLDSINLTKSKLIYEHVPMIISIHMKLHLGVSKLQG